MRDSDVLSRKKGAFAGIAMALVIGACSKPDASPSTSGSTASVAAATPGQETCPPTGQWAECSVLYRLERSGVVAKIDSGAKPNEKALTGKALVMTLGRGATLEVYLYPD